MIDFKRPQLTDKAWIDPIFRASGLRSCDYTFPNLIAWAEAFDKTVAPIEGFVAVYMGMDGGYYEWSAGSGDRRALLCALAQDAEERGRPFRLLGLTEEQVGELDGMFPGKFTFDTYRNAADYCYTVDKLADLAGKKLHAKRNHIHRFEENYPDWRVEEIDKVNLNQCLALAQDWEQAQAEAGLDDWNERKGENALRLCIRYYEELELEGLVLYGEGRPLAFTMGRSIGGDTYDVIVEKAYADIQGAYAMINREFARWVRVHHPEIAYLNREDDMGEPGLRKAKLSYHPDLMVEKYLAVLKPGETL